MNKAELISRVARDTRVTKVQATRWSIRSSNISPRAQEGGEGQPRRLRNLHRRPAPGPHGPEPPDRRADHHSGTARGAVFGRQVAPFGSPLNGPRRPVA